MDACTDVQIDMSKKLHKTHTQGGKSGFDKNLSYSLSIKRVLIEELFAPRLMLHCLYLEADCENSPVSQDFILLAEPLFI